MHHIFTWHPVLLFFCFVLFALLLYAIGAVFLRRFMRQAQNDTSYVPATVLLSALATTWSLAFGFIAADVWGANSHAEHAASAERSALSRLLGLTQVDALNNEVLQQQLQTYRRLVVGNEWGRDVNQFPHSEVEQTLQAIRLALLDEARVGNTPPAIMVQMVNDFDELQDARNERLAIGASHINHSKWYFLVALSVWVQIAMSAIHADKLHGGRKAAFMYAVVVAMSLYVLVLHGNPYAGIASIEAQTLFSMPF